MPRKPKKRIRHTLKWFQNRRGKTIYRKPIKTIKGKKCCDMCSKKQVEIFRPQKGVPDHAQYLFECQNELEIQYFDKPVGREKHIED